jgi:hypothetical protein
MPGAERGFGFSRAQAPALYFLGGRTYTMPDQQAVTLPHDCSIIIISAETADVYWNVNANAIASAPGFVYRGTSQTLGPIANLSSFYIHGPTATVHLSFWRLQ